MCRIIFAFFLSTLLFNFSLHAQTISKIKGNEVTVDTNGVNFKEGETVNFIDDSLNNVGKGVVKKISEGKTTVKVEVTEGQPNKFIKVERIKNAAINTDKLSQEEKDIVTIGEISDTAYIWGGIISIWPIGFGTGHAIQGRYKDKGYIFTISESVALGAVVAGFANCMGSTDYWSRSGCDSTLAILGIYGFVGFRIWEIVDAWAGVPTHNRRLREIQERNTDSGLKFEGFTLTGFKFSF